MRLIATCKIGLESLVSSELEKLGIDVERVEDARVTFLGGFEAVARANLWLRCAERVLLEVGSFPARSFDELFEGVKSLDWKRVLSRDAFIHVNGKSAKSALFSVSDCQSITKKAIVENLKSAYRTDVLPESGREVIVEVGLLRDTATLALDCSGAGLSRRGYRTYNVTAPLSETLGAAIVLLSRHKPEQPLIDPMCGSGTMPIEAAMIAQNRAPGLHRGFAAESWGFVDQRVWLDAREAAMDAIRPVKLDILGSDIDERSIGLCKKHAKNAGIMVDWAVRSIEDIKIDKSGGVIVCNPPYGDRMMTRDEVARLYRTMRTSFDTMGDWTKNIISGYPEFERVYGKRADKRRKLSNGGTACTLYQYFR